MFEWAPPPTPGSRVWTLGPRLAALFGEVTYMAEWVSEVAGGLVGPSLSVVSPGPLLPDLLESGEPLPHSPPRWVESREWSHFPTHHTVSPEPGRTFSPCLSHFPYLLGHSAMRANNTFSGVILHFTYHITLWQWENAVLTNVKGLPVTCFCNFLFPALNIALSNSELSSMSFKGPHLKKQIASYHILLSVRSKLFIFGGW